MYVAFLSDWQLWFKTSRDNVAIDDITMVDCAFPFKTGVCNLMQLGCDNGACIYSDQVIISTITLRSFINVYL